MKLENKIAIVTGASSGMGRAIALAYAHEGATVVAIARRVEQLNELAKSAECEPGKIVAYPGDLSKQDVCEAAVAYTVEQFGRVDILVNNAGIADQNLMLDEVDDENWNKVMMLDLYSPFWTSRAAIRDMLKHESGVIINVASVGGLCGGRAGVAYTAAKHALIGMTKNTGYMYSDKGIRCNAICPGGVLTEIMTKGVGFEHSSKVGTERMMLGTKTAARAADPSEIASVAVFLACEDSSFVTGVSLVADGGWIAY